MELILDNLKNYSYLNFSDRFLDIEFRHLLKKLHRSEVSNQNLSVIQTLKEQIPDPSTIVRMDSCETALVKNGS